MNRSNIRVEAGDTIKINGKEYRVVKMWTRGKRIDYNLEEVKK